MSLYHKYRPKTFDEMIGNEETINSLKLTLNKKEVPHTYLFHGPTGCGKTTLGRIVASSLNIRTELREINTADYRGIDVVRDLRNKSNYKPLKSDAMVFLLDECHELTGTAQNAFLKLLEDTPDHVFFVLCTTNPSKLIPELIGRCVKFQVDLLSEKQTVNLLRRIVKEENKGLTKDVYYQIADTSKGSPRNAINILEILIDNTKEEQLKLAKSWKDEETNVIDLCRALLQQSTWKKVKGMLEGLKKVEPETIRRTVLGYCQSVMLGNSSTSNVMIAANIIFEFSEPFYNSGFAGVVLSCHSVINEK